MRKALTLLVMIVAPTPTFAQGTIVFQNDSRGQVMLWTSATDSTPIAVPKGNSMVDLITAAHGTPLSPFGTLDSRGFVVEYPTLAIFLHANPGWHSEAVGGVNAANGIFNNGSVSLTGIPAGASADYCIIGWTGTSPNYDSARANGAFLGQSAIFTTLTGDATTPVNLNATFIGMTLAPQYNPIPEPSIFALFALGAATLVPLRRRR
jgi:hypothetical protein